METLWEAYVLVKANHGAPGIDGMTFDDIEHVGEEEFLKQIQEELRTRTYRPLQNRKKEIPKDGGKKVRILSIPSIRDRVVQGALKLILEPIFEADFQEGSFGYRPKRSAHQAVARVAEAIVQGKTHVIDVDLKAYFDNVSHSILLSKVAERIDDPDVMHLLKMILKASGDKGVPQGGVISPVASNLYLNEVDKMLEIAQAVTRTGKYTNITYARFADDLVILVDGHSRHEWLRKAVHKRLREEFAKIQVEVNEEKSRVVDLTKEESFGFLGFEFRRVMTRRGVWRADYAPKMKKRAALLEKLKGIFGSLQSQPIRDVIGEVNPIVSGWVNYFRIGHSSRCFHYVRRWIDQKVRRHMARARGRRGFGWKRWSKEFIYGALGLHDDYQVRYFGLPKALPTR
jgi:RNA-directed DNA polymerase